MKIIEEVKVVRYIQYDGIRFYQDGKRYWLGQVNGKRKRLHIYVWEKHNGAIPKGYHIHHKDYDTDNNEIDNLEILTEHVHLSLHGAIEKNKASARKCMEKHARPQAIKWHKSDKSTGFHKEHYKKTLGKLHEQRISKVCIVCGDEFNTSGCKTDAKYCSNACKSQYRRDSGVDNVSRTCISCGDEFTTNKYSKAKTCCGKCTMDVRFNRA